MLIALIIIICLGAAFGIGFGITGALVLALLFVIKLPIVLILWILGAVCCCTILLIPLGLILFRTGSAILI